MWRQEFRLAVMRDGHAQRTLNGMRPQAVRCLIVDDIAGFRKAARKMLERGGIAVVGTASNSEEALRHYVDLRPDVTLVDVDLGVESGFELAHKLSRIGWPQPSPVILTSSHAEQDFADLIAASPAVGFLPKDELSASAIIEMLDDKGTLTGRISELPER
jgi:DNA-binding NarL/FixJ family response regulator